MVVFLCCGRGVMAYLALLAGGELEEDVSGGIFVGLSDTY